MVESAARHSFEFGGPVWPWSQLSPKETEPRIERMRAALDAIAPMVEKLHREWYSDGYEEGSADACDRYVLGKGL